MSDAPSPVIGPVAPGQPSVTAGLMTLASVVVVIAALSIAHEVFIPITLAVLLSFVLAPLVAVLRRLWLGRVLAVLLAVLFALCVIIGTTGVIGQQIAGLAGDVPRYASTVQEKLHFLQAATLGRLAVIADRVAAQTDRNSAAVSATTPAKTGAAGDTKNQAARPIPVEVHAPDPSATELARRVLQPILGPLANTGIVVIVAIFILLRKEDVRDRMIRLLGTGDIHRTMMAMDEAGYRLSRYFLTLLALNTAFGCIIGVGLYVIGVPSPVLWGIVAILMRFVPYIGSPLSALLPLALAAAVVPGWSLVLWTAALFVVAELVMGQVIEPIAYGRSTGLSPLSVVIAAIFWGWLWGPVGLILSMPLTLCLVILGRHVDRLKFLDVLLGDRPALTSVEGFYHRLLAGHLDEVSGDAEETLKTCTLASYYDNVAIPGLRLAVADLERGVLTDAQTVKVTGGVSELLDELSDHEDIDPVPVPDDGSRAVLPPDQPDHPVHHEPDSSAADVSKGLSAAWQQPSAILCVAGRGAFDEAVSAMLGQLLERRGFGTKAVPNAAVRSQLAIGAIDMASVQMVCLTYASIADGSFHLRYIVRRLRSRNPAIKIVLGLLPGDVAASERLRSAVGADMYAASLHEAVAACVAQAAGDVSAPVLA